MRFGLFSLSVILLVSSCARTRVKDHPDWGKEFEKYGIKDACFIMRDHNHESIQFYNQARCTQRFLPASTFKIFNSLVALYTAVAPDENLVIKWDGIHRRTDWDTDMTMAQAFKVSCVPYYQEIARRIGPARMQHYLDTVRYGNMTIGGAIDTFWLNNSLQISADEEIGFLKKMYFYELPFDERTQRIVKAMMLHEQTPQYKLYYKTGMGRKGNNYVYWVVGFAEKTVRMKELEGSMNKADFRDYPYFFAENFELPASDTSKDWTQVRIDVLKNILRDYEVLPRQ